MSQQPFELSLLASPALVIFLTVFCVSLAGLRRPDMALVIAFLKAGFYLVYFGWFFDGTFTYLDDWTYLERGAEIRDSDVGLFNFFENLPMLIALSEGEHFLYYLFNAIAFGWFGTGYFAPVALNVILTAFIALVGARLAAVESLISPRNVKLFFIFLILHPDISAWSTLVNGKDILVLLLHVLLLYAISLALREQRARAVIFGGLSVSMLLFLRFYVPVIFVIAFIMNFVSRMRGVARWRIISVAVLMLAVLISVVGIDAITGAVDSLREHFVNPVIGLVRFALTPIPLNTEASFAFLEGPALLHWLLLPALLLGARKIFRMKSPFSRFLVLYALTFTALYAVYGELQGPRHRVQLDYVIALFQFVGIFVIRRLTRPESMLRDARAGRNQQAKT